MPLKISRILHAGYVFETAKLRIAFDPLFENPFSVNCYAYPNVEFDHEQIKNIKFDAIFISHYHDDHCSFDSLNLISRDTPIYIYCLFAELIELIKDLGFKKVTPLILNKAVKMEDLEIIPLRALDADVDSIFHIKHQNLNILNVVDSWLDLETLELLKNESWDLVLWPFQTMLELAVLLPFRAEKASRVIPIEWQEQLVALNPKNVIPSSCQFIHEEWSWYREAYFPISYKSFLQTLNVLLPNTNVFKLNPAQSIYLNNNSISSATDLKWIIPKGEQNVDYKFTDNISIPSAAEIAQNFVTLSEIQKNRITFFCLNELKTTYSRLELINDSYFSKPKIWQLSILNSDGNSENYFYGINNQQIELIDSTQMIDWKTEIPAIKLFNAIEEGESLSSLYLRINDFKFSVATEAALANMDLMQDPLIRVLYDGKFASYQKAQLKRIKRL